MGNLDANKNTELSGTEILGVRIPKALKKRLKDITKDKIVSSDDINITLTDTVIEALERGIKDTEPRKSA